jgi:hypothetical protein
MIHRWSRRHIPVLGAWLAFLAGLQIGGELADVSSYAIAAVSGAIFVFAGFAAASRCRPLPGRAPAERLRFALMSLAVGTLLGIANLGANWSIAQIDPDVRALLVQRMATLQPLEGLLASPLVEEVAVRLFLMSVLAWVVFRFTGRATLAFALALFGSSVFFALLHLARPFPGDPGLANYYRAALLVKYTLAGLPLGWIFWRWGLPYSILCHIAANAAHLALQSRIFAP